MTNNNTRLPEDKLEPLCYAAGNLKLCNLCYRNPEKRKAAMMNQEYVCGAVSYSKGQYHCAYFVEISKEMELDK